MSSGKRRFIISLLVFLTLGIPGYTVAYSDKEPKLLHETMDIAIGYPAVINQGEDFPSIEVYPESKGLLNVYITSEDDGSIYKDHPIINLTQGDTVIIEFSGSPSLGRYRIHLKLEYDNGKEIYDSFYFSVLDPKRLLPDYSLAVHPDKDGKLVYNADYRGNRIPDFSTVGYMAGEVPIPDVPVKIVLEPIPGDNTERIQEAINELSKMEPDENGFRGAILLKKGIYEINDYLIIAESGIVLRGEGRGEPEVFDTDDLPFTWKVMGQDFWLDPVKRYTLDELKDSLKDKEATILIATGKERRTLINVQGGREYIQVPKGDLLESYPRRNWLSDPITILAETKSDIIDQYVPVGAKSFRVENPEFFEVGDPIIILRIGNSEWISEIQMDQIPPRPDGGRITQWSPFNLEFENIITSIDGDKIYVKHPIVNAIEKQWGGGRIYRYEDDGRIQNVGIENLHAISYWRANEDWVDDTRHSEKFIDFDNIKNAWVRDVTKEHFYSRNGAIQIGRRAISITIQDCSTLIADRGFYYGPGYDPSGRTFYETDVYVGRYGYRIEGQLNLVMRTYAVNNRHAFTFGSRVPGPNVFHDSIGHQSLTWSEPHHRWSVGGLYDIVDDMIALMNRLWYGTGHGWAGANYVAWNTRGELVCQQPPTAQNWAIGHAGKKDEGPFANYAENGYWESHGRHVQPISLYLQQLKDRMNGE